MVDVNVEGIGVESLYQRLVENVDLESLYQRYWWLAMGIESLDRESRWLIPDHPLMKVPFVQLFPDHQLVLTSLDQQTHQVAQPTQPSSFDRHVGATLVHHQSVQHMIRGHDFE